MFSYIKELSNRYSKFWLNTTNMGKPENLFSIDFKKPWWTVFIERKILFVFILSGRILSRIITTMLPAFITYAVASKKFSSFGLLFSVWMFAELYRFVSIAYCSKFISSVMSGLKYSSYKFFLTIDPICHSKKSTGEVFSKIERCAYAYEKLIDATIYDVLPMIVGVFTVIVSSFFTINLTLGLLAFVFLFIICAFNAFTIFFNSLAFEKKVIKADDEVKKGGVESLIQIQLVRSSFATNEVNKDMEGKNTSYMAVDGTFYISFHALMFITRTLYLASLCVLGFYIIYLVINNVISISVGTTFLVTYLLGTYDIVKIGDKLQQAVRSITRIRDLFGFINNFGKKTFPVLKEDPTKEYEMPTEDVISLQAKNLYFAYNDISIFRGHSLDFVVPEAQQNKLYGIIGPSGAGKTTFISILGGQIKPYIGNIEINDIPIYEVDDNFRRGIIAVQGQAASGLSGTLKENLLLGIPKKISLFSDDYIIEVLKRVGVWDIFKDKGGLNSIIDEGGVNMSQGQRQRINFASLYIRTKYYGPLLVLIDEPTSSLDEVSEQSITDMIHEIAKNSLVFVIAHRLRTLDDAVAILDFSLLSKEKDIIFYSRAELEKKSVFYQKLICGEYAIEE